MTNILRTKTMLNFALLSFHREKNAFSTYPDLKESILIRNDSLTTYKVEK